MSIGRKLKVRREELGLTVKQVAERVGMAGSTLYDLEREEQQSMTKLAALCKLYGLNPDWVEFSRGVRLLTEAPTEAARKSATLTVHGMQVTPEEVEVGIEWGKLDEPARTAVRQQIYLLVADQVRRKRAAKRKSDRERDGDHGQA